MKAIGSAALAVLIGVAALTLAHPAKSGATGNKPVAAAPATSGAVALAR